MKRSRYVILVEDDPTVLHSLRLQMRQILPKHYLLETANDGQEALEVLQEITDNDGLVPLIVTDHQMPNMTGSEFLMAVKHMIPRCRNIMLTGEAGLSDITALINEQALFRYLTKPWNQSDLEMTVLSALESFNQEFKLEKLNQELAQTNANLELLVEERTRELRNKTVELRKGLEYAKLMQENLLPSTNSFSHLFKTVEVFFRPHTSVSGDFYSFHQIAEHEAILVLGDATGHGIAGAFLSSICLGIINDINGNTIISNPKEILNEVLTRFRKLSSFATETMKQMVSVELTIVHLQFDSSVLGYASNSKQLTLLKNDIPVKIEETMFQCCPNEGDRIEKLKNRGRTGEIPLMMIDSILLTSDGIPDQFVESTKRKLGRKQLIASLPDIRQHCIPTWFNGIQGSEPNTDDATMILIDL